MSRVQYLKDRGVVYYLYCIQFLNRNYEVLPSVSRGKTKQEKYVVVACEGSGKGNKPIQAIIIILFKEEKKTHTQLVKFTK